MQSFRRTPAASPAPAGSATQGARLLQGMSVARYGCGACRQSQRSQVGVTPVQPCLQPVLTVPFPQDMICVYALHTVAKDNEAPTADTAGRAAVRIWPEGADAGMCQIVALTSHLHA